MRIIQFLAIISFISACTTVHHGAMTSSNAPEGPKKYVDFAIGFTKATYVFGIGGNTSHTMIQDAKRKMMLLYPLKANQYFDQMSYETRITKSLFISTHKIYVTADVMESEQANGASFSNDYKFLFPLAEKDTSRYNLHTNELVYLYKAYKNIYPAKIVELLPNNFVRVAFTRPVDRKIMKIKAFSISNILKCSFNEKNEPKKEYPIGSEINVLELIFEGSTFKNVKGIIIAKDALKVVVKTEYGLYGCGYKNLKAPL